MIPLCLVTGFLGSGKTTFLEKVIARSAGRKILYVVNEFSPLDVDGGRLDLEEGELQTVSGGSIFCKCKVTDFINVLQGISENHNDLEGVVIEASGIADPRVVRKMLVETKLDRDYRIGRIISIVDPGSFHKLLKTLPNIVYQIESADTVLLNKIDRYERETIDRTREEIRGIQPGAEIIECSYAAAETELFSETEDRKLSGEYAKCVDPNYSRETALIEKPVDWELLKAAIDEKRGQIYRAKGYVPTAEGTLYADLSPAGWEVCKSSRADARKGLALIASGIGKDAICDLRQRIESGEFAA